jgi:N-acyl-D-aspartate/D-glutamate deacylase
LSRYLGRPFTFNLMQMRSLGDHYRRVLELAVDANEHGAQLRPQTTPRGIGVLFGLAANTPIDDLPSYAAVRDCDFAGRVAMLRDAAVRDRLVEDGLAADASSFDRMYLMTPETGASYCYGPEDSIGAHARRLGTSPVRLYLDTLVATDGRAVVNWPVLNEDFDAIAELLRSPVTIMGLADAGAHATQIMDASQPTFFLSHWVRDQGVMTIEEGVRRLTSDTAGFVGYRDRGVLRAGAYADVNVIDLDAMWLPIPEIVHDFPGAAPRFVQRARGIDHTVVNGQPFLDHGEHTGALPGRLLRSTD